MTPPASQRPSDGSRNEVLYSKLGYSFAVKNQRNQFASTEFFLLTIPRRSAGARKRIDFDFSLCQVDNPILRNPSLGVQAGFPVPVVEQSGIRHFHEDGNIPGRRMASQVGLFRTANNCKIR